MKSGAEAMVRDALRERGLFVYKPPDDARNWKPADFLTWERMDEDPEGRVALVRSRWIEVKTVTRGHVLPARDLRPSQLAGVSEALKLGIPYLLIVWWKPDQEWTVAELTAMQRDGRAWTESLPYVRTDPHETNRGPWLVSGTLRRRIMDAVLET